MDRSTLRNILSVGRLAVSPYNIQPWRFKISENNRVLVYIQKERGGFWDFANVGYFIVGCLLENISVAAKNHGYGLIDTHLPQHQDINYEKYPILELHFEKLEGLFSNESIDHLSKRHTNRGSYEKKRLPPEIIQQIKKIYCKNTSLLYDLGGNSKFIRLCASIERIRFMNPYTFQEIVRYIVKDTNTKPKNMLPTGSLSLSFLPRLLLNAIQKNYIGTSMIKSQIASVGANVHKKLLQSSPHLFLFIQKDTTATTMVNSWRKIQRILNYLYKSNVQSQLICSSIDLLRMKSKIFSSKEISKLNIIQRELTFLIGENPYCYFALLRAGYGRDSKYQSTRFDLDDLII